jgi:hypothetical protein
VVEPDAAEAAPVQHRAMHDRTTSRVAGLRSAGAALERDRLQARTERMQAVVRELRYRAHYHEQRHGAVPPPLNRAIADFVQEMRAAERRIAELARRDGRARKAR